MLLLLLLMVLLLLGVPLIRSKVSLFHLLMHFFVFIPIRHAVQFLSIWSCNRPKSIPSAMTRFGFKKNSVGSPAHSFVVGSHIIRCTMIHMDFYPKYDRQLRYPFRFICFVVQISWWYPQPRREKKTMFFTISAYSIFIFKSRPNNGQQSYKAHDKPRQTNHRRWVLRKISSQFNCSSLIRLLLLLLLLLLLRCLSR